MKGFMQRRSLSQLSIFDTLMSQDQVLLAERNKVLLWVSIIMTSTVAAVSVWYVFATHHVDRPATSMAKSDHFAEGQKEQAEIPVISVQSYELWKRTIFISCDVPGSWHDSTESLPGFLESDHYDFQHQTIQVKTHDIKSSADDIATDEDVRAEDPENRSFDEKEADADAETKYKKPSIPGSSALTLEHRIQLLVAEKNDYELEGMRQILDSSRESVDPLYADDNLVHNRETFLELFKEPNQILDCTLDAYHGKELVPVLMCLLVSVASDDEASFGAFLVERLLKSDGTSVNLPLVNKSDLITLYKSTSTVRHQKVDSDLFILP